MAGLTLDSLCAGYGGRTIVEDVSLEIASGELVALLGPNGAGKSTALKACFGLARVSAGDVRLDGESVRGLRPAACLARGLAYVPQGGQVFGPLTVAENVALARAFHPAAATDDPFLNEALAGLAERRAALLSGGERQQLALAMALAGRPRVLLVDEPSIGLAPRAARAALAALDQLRRNAGLTVVLVEQNVNLALEVADRVALLVGGRLVAVAAGEAVRGDEALRRRFTLGLEPEAEPGAAPRRP
jgi:branched-chain amino acid transport system ATP-binding protein